MVELSKIAFIVGKLVENSSCFLDLGHVERESPYLNLDFHHKATIYPLDLRGNIVFNEYLCVKIYRDHIRFFGSKHSEYSKRLEKLRKNINKIFSQIWVR